MNQTKAVLDYLKKRGNITSMQAIEMFGATRLADIIFRLRGKGYNIETIDCVGVNRFGDRCTFAKYVLLESEE